MRQVALLPSVQPSPVTTGQQKLHRNPVSRLVLKTAAESRNNTGSKDRSSMSRSQMRLLDNGEQKLTQPPADIVPASNGYASSASDTALPAEQPSDMASEEWMSGDDEGYFSSSSTSASEFATQPETLSGTSSSDFQLNSSQPRIFDDGDRTSSGNDDGNDEGFFTPETDTGGLRSSASYHYMPSSQDGASKQSPGNDMAGDRPERSRRRYGVRSRNLQQDSLAGPQNRGQDGQEQERLQLAQVSQKSRSRAQSSRILQDSAASSSDPSAAADISRKLRRQDSMGGTVSVLEDSEMSNYANGTNRREAVGDPKRRSLRERPGQDLRSQASSSDSQTVPDDLRSESRGRYRSSSPKSNDKMANSSSSVSVNGNSEWYVDWGWDTPSNDASPSSDRPTQDGQASASSSASSTGSYSSRTDRARGRRQGQSSNAGSDPQSEGDQQSEEGRPNRRWWQGFRSRKANASAFADGNTRAGQAGDGKAGSQQAADGRESVDDWSSDEGSDVRPDITRLEPAELDLLMPLVPSVPQLQIATGGPTNLLQRCAGSLLGTLVFYKVVLLASASLTFPLWSPVLVAAARNWDVKKSCRFVGLWRTAVMDVSLKGRRRVTSPGSPSGQAISLLLGDDSGLRSSVSLPYNAQFDQIQVGDAAELLVTSSRKDFSTFKALREVYLPQTGIWLSEYPLTSRQAFLDISLAVEDERQQAAAPR